MLGVRKVLGLVLTSLKILKMKNYFYWAFHLLLCEKGVSTFFGGELFGHFCPFFGTRQKFLVILGDHFLSFSFFPLLGLIFVLFFCSLQCLSHLFISTMFLLFQIVAIWKGTALVSIKNYVSRSYICLTGTY